MSDFFFKNFSFTYVSRSTKIFLVVLDVFESAKTPIQNGSKFYLVTVLTMHCWPFLCYVLRKPLINPYHCQPFPYYFFTNPFEKTECPHPPTHPPKSADVIYGWYLSRLENLQSQVNLFNVAIQRAFLGQQFATVRTNYAFNI